MLGTQSRSPCKACYLLDILPSLLLLLFLVSCTENTRKTAIEPSAAWVPDTSQYVRPSSDTIADRASFKYPDVKPRFSATTPQEAYDEGFDNGYEDGCDEGHANNDMDDYDDSCPYKGKMKRKYQEGYENGYQDGNDDGLEEYDIDRQPGEDPTDW